MTLTFALLLAAAAPALAAHLWRRRRLRLSLERLPPGRTVAYTTIAQSCRRY